MKRCYRKSAIALLLSAILLGTGILTGYGTQTPESLSSSSELQTTSSVFTDEANVSRLVSVQPVYEYETQELYASRDGNQIYGIAYIPQNAGEQMPAIIYSHGFGGSNQTGSAYAEAMAARGYVVYCFDFCGGSPGSRSDGSTLEMSMFTEQADLEAVLEMVQDLEFVDSDNIFLLGTSQGGAVSALAGAEHADEIRGMILLYPAFVLVDTAIGLFPTPDEIPETYHFMWMEVGRAYFEPLLGYDIYADIAAYGRDVLLIHGDADSIVPLSYSERALDAYPSARLEVIEGAGHGFYGENQETAIRYITDYCNSYVAMEDISNE